MQQEQMSCFAGCAASLTRVAKEATTSGESEVFSDFVGAVMNSLIYLLEDSIQRLQDIHNIEASKADTKAWERLSSE